MDEMQRPIGVFDSGVGGISVLRELVALMPNENFIFYGDSKNAPYGTKTLEEVRKLTLADAEYLRSRNVKALVVACNTATSAAIHILREKYQKEIPVIGIEPALSISYSAQTALLPLSVRFTTSLRSICSFSSVTWEMIPTMRLSPASSPSTSIACCLDCASREPNPSSINIISGWIAPALRSTISDNPSAIASAARKDSPPDSVFTSRSLSVTRL